MLASTLGHSTVAILIVKQSGEDGYQNTGLQLIGRRFQDLQWLDLTPGTPHEYQCLVEQRTTKKDVRPGQLGKLFGESCSDQVPPWRDLMLNWNAHEMPHKHFCSNRHFYFPSFPPFQPSSSCRIGSAEAFSHSCAPMVTGPRIFIIYPVHDSVVLRPERGQFGDQPGNAHIRAAQYTLLVTGKPVFAC